MSEIIYLLCAGVSAMCTVVLTRGYFRSHNRLLLWSAICFAIMAVSNSFLCIDLIVYPNVDFNGPLWRNSMNALAGSVLLTGLILEAS